jgi:DnaJ-class molecular chaperone
MTGLSTGAKLAIILSVFLATSMTIGAIGLGAAYQLSQHQQAQSFQTANQDEQSEEMRGEKNRDREEATGQERGQRRDLCPWCNGTGGGRMCYQCKGTGTEDYSAYGNPYNVDPSESERYNSRHTFTCRNCNGKGEVYCRHCNGTGKW